MFDFLKKKDTTDWKKRTIQAERSLLVKEKLFKEAKKDAEEWRDIAIHYKIRHENIQRSRNALVELINRKGGQEFLDYARIPGRNDRSVQQKSMFTDSELKTLLILIHPDKHGKGRHGEMAEQLFKSISNMVR